MPEGLLKLLKFNSKSSKIIDHITEEALLHIVQGHAKQAFFTSEYLEKKAVVGQADYTLDFWVMTLKTMIFNITVSHISI